MLEDIGNESNKNVYKENGTNREFFIGEQNFKINGGTDTQATSTKNSLIDIFVTERGQEGLAQLKAREQKEVFVVDLAFKGYVGKKLSNYKIGINIDMIDKGIDYITAKGAMKITLTRAIAHEIGYAVFGTKDISITKNLKKYTKPYQTYNMLNISKNENIIMRQLGDFNDRICRGAGCRWVNNN